MRAWFIEDDDAPNLQEHRHFAALASIRSQELVCAVLREHAIDASAAYESAQAHLVHLRMILESLNDSCGEERYPAPVPTMIGSANRERSVSFAA